MNRNWLLLLLISTVLSAQSIHSRPAFENYSARQIYKGTPAPPKLDKHEKMFRIVIRKGAKSEVQFAGHYTVPIFGCGAGCANFYIVDSITGKVYDGSCPENGLRYRQAIYQNESSSFQQAAC